MNEFKNQNDELVEALISWMRKDISDNGKWASIPIKHIKLVEKIKQKSIEEILREDS